MKGLILCAGRGSRLQPFSYLTSKVLLPVANKPLIFYNIEKCIALGITDIGLVIRPSQRDMFLDAVGTGERWGIRLTYIYQHHPKGIADAVRQAEAFIANDAFLLLLGDNLIANSLEAMTQSVIREGHDGALLLGEVTKPQDYGIVEIKDGVIIGLEEKPAQPKSNLAIMGAYAFTPKIFSAVRSISPSQRGEYEMTDAISYLIDQRHSISYDVTYDSHTDVGTTERWLEANRWMLDKLAGQKSGAYASGTNTFIPPVLIDPSSRLEHCTVGPYVVVGPHVVLKDCELKDSILLEEVFLSRCKLKGSIVSRQYAVPPLEGDA